MNQRTKAHPQLATARNALMGVLDISRRDACVICNDMTGDQVQGVLDAAGDRGKVDAIILSMKPQPEEEPAEPEKKTRRAKASARSSDK